MNEIARLLLQIAERFELYASDQRASVRFQRTAKDKALCLIRADVWASAADELREIATQVDAPDPLSYYQLKQAEIYQIAAAGQYAEARRLVALGLMHKRAGGTALPNAEHCFTKATDFQLHASRYAALSRQFMGVE